MKKTLVAAMTLTLVSFMAQAAENSIVDKSTTTEHAKPDNTEVNKRDRGEQTLTPMDQSNAKEDINITQAIRKSIMKQHLSTNAKNVKIITMNGEVTLRGPVNSSAEEKQIVKLAKAVPSIKKLTNQLEVK